MLVCNPEAHRLLHNIYEHPPTEQHLAFPLRPQPHDALHHASRPPAQSDGGDNGFIGIGGRSRTSTTELLGRTELDLTMELEDVDAEALEQAALMASLAAHVFRATRLPNPS